LFWSERKESVRRDDPIDAFRKRTLDIPLVQIEVSLSLLLFLSNISIFICFFHLISSHFFFRTQLRLKFTDFGKLTFGFLEYVIISFFRYIGMSGKGWKDILSDQHNLITSSSISYFNWKCFSIFSEWQLWHVVGLSRKITWFHSTGSVAQTLVILTPSFPKSKLNEKREEKRRRESFDKLNLFLESQRDFSQSNFRWNSLLNSFIQTLLLTFSFLRCFRGRILCFPPFGDIVKVVQKISFGLSAHQVSLSFSFSLYLLDK